MPGAGGLLWHGQENAMPTRQKPHSNSWTAALIGVLATVGLILGWGVSAVGE
jgi:hypothetical protein